MLGAEKAAFQKDSDHNLPSMSLHFCCTSYTSLSGMGWEKNRSRGVQSDIEISGANNTEPWGTTMAPEDIIIIQTEPEQLSETIIIIFVLAVGLIHRQYDVCARN